MRKKVMLGMSGGVDSSVAACLLKEKGYDIIGVTLKLWEDSHNLYSHIQGCGSVSCVNDAKKVADILDIPHYTLDFCDIFNNHVISNFISEYSKGRTPNPCIQCNKYIKFGHLLKAADEMNIEYVATGHYAVNEYSKQLNKYVLKNSLSSVKDQTYVLYNMTQAVLSRTLFPTGQYTKEEIRKIAVEYNLPIADKKDSQDICFIPDNNYIRFLEANKVTFNPGNFIDKEGNVLGKHTGIANYTIGQRKGLGIAFGKPMYVTNINSEDNTITLGEEGSQYTKSLIASDVNLIYLEDISSPIRCKAKIRYSAKPADATAFIENNILHVDFDTPQRSVTPGQSVVLYDNDIVIGGGLII